MFDVANNCCKGLCWSVRGRILQTGAAGKRRGKEWLFMKILIWILLPETNLMELTAAGVYSATQLCLAVQILTLVMNAVLPVLVFALALVIDNLSIT